ncbi:M48 family metallopeptidase [bacterium]|nr:M48 family metallopeptidase [bacterium]
MSKRIKYLPVFLAVVFLISCATVPITGRQQLSLIPQSQLLGMSFDGYNQVLSESKLSQDPEKVQMIRAVGARIAASAEAFLRDNGMEGDIANYDWEFNLIEDDEMVNAWCMPGGKVAFYTGILPVCEDAAGVAVVMGHEVAHAIANHGGERMSQGLMAQLGGVALDVALAEKPEETRQLAMLAYGVGAQVGVLLPYSRTHESEGDHIGLILMARAGYDPRAAVPFWERMNQMGGARPPEFLSTHPNPETRVEQLHEWMPEALQYYNP